MDNNQLINAIAAEVRAERAAKKMTIAELSQASRVPEATLNRYLAGKRDIPGSTLLALAGALGVEPGQILNRAALRAQGE